VIDCFCVVPRPSYLVKSTQHSRHIPHSGQPVADATDSVFVACEDAVCSRSPASAPLSLLVAENPETAALAGACSSRTSRRSPATCLNAASVAVSPGLLSFEETVPAGRTLNLPEWSGYTSARCMSHPGVRAGGQTSLTPSQTSRSVESGQTCRYSSFWGRWDIAPAYLARVSSLVPFQTKVRSSEGVTCDSGRCEKLTQCFHATLRDNQRYL
jgi:hypothetical protein